MHDISWQPHTEIHKIDTLRIDQTTAFSAIKPYFNFVIDTTYGYSIIYYSGGRSGLTGAYARQSDSFQLVFKLVPQIPGTYFLKMGNDVFAGSLSKQTYPGDCFNGNRNSFDVFSTVNENRDNNFDFLLESPDSLYFDFYHRSRSNFREKGGYCFKVIK
jgi:hypothetical protein